MIRRARTAFLRNVLTVLSACASPAAMTAQSERASNEPIHPLPAPTGLDPARVALGARLFRAPRLSGDGRLSWQSCHDIASNGAGHRALNEVDGRPPPVFNTPTVFNATLSFRLNRGGKLRTLHEQALASLQNPGEMRADVATLVRRLRGDAGSVRDFERAYRRPPDRVTLLDAIASDERALTTPGSRFDRWLQGDDDALTAQELRGYRSCTSVGCIACHQGRGVGGNLFQRSGVFSPAARHSVARLRVPSLRNVAATAPYFHDGSAPTLECAIDAMARAQLAVVLRREEIADIAAFLRALTGNHDGHPVTDRTR